MTEPRTTCFYCGLPTDCATALVVCGDCKQGIEAEKSKKSKCIWCEEGFTECGILCGVCHGKFTS